MTSTERVSAIMRLCNEARVGVVPAGGNTGYCGGATPSEDGSQIVLPLARMRCIRAVDPLNYTMPATTCATCSSAPKARSESSLPRRANCFLGRRRLPSSALPIRTSAILQAYASRSTVQHADDVEELRENKYQLSIGLQQRAGQVLWSFAVTENISNFSNTPDIGAPLALAYFPIGR